MNPHDIIDFVILIFAVTISLNADHFFTNSSAEKRKRIIKLVRISTIFIAIGFTMKILYLIVHR